MEGKSEKRSDLKSAGLCFLCSSKIPQRGSDSLSKLSRKCSWKSISNYLKLDFKEECNFEVELCIACADINDKFSKLYRQLRGIKKEVISCLKDIHDRIEGAEKLENSTATRTAAGKVENKLELGQKIRLDTLHKSKLKLSHSKDGNVKAEEAHKKSDSALLTNLEATLVAESDHEDDDRREGDETQEIDSDIEFDQPDLDATFFEHSPVKVRKAYSSKSEKVPVSYHPVDSSLGQTSKNTGRKTSTFNSNRQKSIPRKNQQCNQCSRSFTQSYALTRHVQEVHSSIRFRCDLCGKELSRQDHLRRHQRKVHNQCVSCGKICLSLMDLKQHTTVDKCGRQFKLAQCSLCEKAFLGQSNLKQHVESAHLKTRYTCQMCTTEFCRKDVLNRHYRNVHNVDPRQVQGDVNRNSQNMVERNSNNDGVGFGNNPIHITLQGPSSSSGDQNPGADVV